MLWDFCLKWITPECSLSICNPSWVPCAFKMSVLNGICNNILRFVSSVNNQMARLVCVYNQLPLLIAVFSTRNNCAFIFLLRGHRCSLERETYRQTDYTQTRKLSYGQNSLAHPFGSHVLQTAAYKIHMLCLSKTSKQLWSLRWHFSLNFYLPGM